MEHWSFKQDKGFHIYCGERRVATFHREAEALAAVAAYNTIVLTLTGDPDNAEAMNDADNIS